MPIIHSAARLKAFAISLSLLFITLSSRLEAHEVDVPLQIDFALLRQLLLQQVYTSEKQTARVLDDGSGCNYLVLANPRIDGQRGLLHTLSDGEAKFGTALGGRCMTLFHWKGSIELFQKPTLMEGGKVIRFPIVESNIYGAGGQITQGILWEQVKQQVHPRLANLQIDLRSPLGELKTLLPLALPKDTEAQIQASLDSLSISTLQIEETGVRATFHFEVSDAPAATTPQPPLSQQELEYWQQAWDGFLTHIVKYAAADAQLEEIRLALLEVLLDARHDILDALTLPAPQEEDPVRALFLKTWSRLAPVLRRLSAELPGQDAVRYLSFITAGEALRALDRVGPAIGLEISSQGLRRLARILLPHIREDSLEYDLEVDPQLRKLFGFGPPLPVSEEPPLIRFDGWFIKSAWAGSLSSQELAKLNRWAPSLDEMDRYLPMVRDLLHQAADAILQSKELDRSFHSIYRWLVLATAWQETCWRQFIRQGDRIKPLISGAGSVGIMQVNQKVWRGFYNINGLHHDIAYNAKAGGEILLHYFTAYALKKKEHLKTGQRDNLARATYALYNGGPRHLQRYRLAQTDPKLRKIDQLFWEKYQTIKKGDELAVARCFGRSVTAAVPKTPQSVKTASLKREAWLLQQNPKAYTLQLIAGQSEKALLAYLDEHGLKEKAAFYHYRRGGKPWFAIVYGFFPDRTQAERAIGRLPAELKKQSPWIRELSAIQEAIKAAQN